MGKQQKSSVFFSIGQGIFKIAFIHHYILIFIFFTLTSCGKNSKQTGENSVQLPNFDDIIQKNDDKAKIPLFVYGGGGGLAGRYPEKYMEDQLRFVAKRFKAGLWIYGGTGVSEKLKEYNPKFETYMYYNFMYHGCYRTGMGEEWLPCEDWEYVKKHADTMLAKNTSPENPHPKKWIQNPIWKDEYLVNILDVNPENPDDPTHWRGFFTNQVAKRVKETGKFTGVFLDEVMPPLPGYPGLYPDEYDENTWFDAMIETLRMLKEKLGENYRITWNGLQQAGLFIPRIWEITEYTDGALIECFATCYMLTQDGYFPPELWKYSLDISIKAMQKGEVMFLQSPIPQDTSPEEKIRIFALASFLLVYESGKTYFFFNHLGSESKGVQYYPEWDIPVSEPLESAKNSVDELCVPSVGSTPCVYMRRFKEMLVVVNPYDLRAKVKVPEGKWCSFSTEGGGVIPEDGNPKGTLRWYKLELGKEGEMEIGPKEGKILLKCG